eukprot:SAG31_NODE_973_length_10632_cov_7.175622_4_plen_1204_part_00
MYSGFPNAVELKRLLQTREPAIFSLEEIAKNETNSEPWSAIGWNGLAQWAEEDFLSSEHARSTIVHVTRLPRAEYNEGYGGGTSKRDDRLPPVAERFGLCGQCSTITMPFVEYVGRFFRDAKSFDSSAEYYLGTQESDLLADDLIMREKLSKVPHRYMGPLRALHEHIPFPSQLVSAMSEVDTKKIPPRPRVEANLWMGSANFPQDIQQTESQHDMLHHRRNMEAAESGHQFISHMHSDNFDNLYAVVKGIKKFTLVAPSAADQLHTIYPIVSVRPVSCCVVRPFRICSLNLNFFNGTLQNGLATQVDPTDRRYASPSPSGHFAMHRSAFDFIKAAAFHVGDHSNETDAVVRDKLLQDLQQEERRRQEKVESATVEVLLQPKQLLFLPAGWFHEVRSYGQHASINFWWENQLPLQPQQNHAAFSVQYSAPVCDIPPEMWLGSHSASVERNGNNTSTPGRTNCRVARMQAHQAGLKYGISPILVVSGLRCHHSAIGEYLLEPFLLNNRPHYTRAISALDALHTNGSFPKLHLYWRSPSALGHSVGAWVIDERAEETRTARIGRRSNDFTPASRNTAKTSQWQLWDEVCADEWQDSWLTVTGRQTSWSLGEAAEAELRSNIGVHDRDAVPLWHVDTVVASTYEWHEHVMTYAQVMKKKDELANEREKQRQGNEPKISKCRSREIDVEIRIAKGARDGSLDVDRLVAGLPHVDRRRPLRLQRLLRRRNDKTLDLTTQRPLLTVPELLAELPNDGQHARLDGAIKQQQASDRFFRHNADKPMDGFVGVAAESGEVIGLHDVDEAACDKFDTRRLEDEHYNLSVSWLFDHIQLAQSSAVRTAPAQTNGSIHYSASSPSLLASSLHKIFRLGGLRRLASAFEPSSDRSGNVEEHVSAIGNGSTIACRYDTMHNLFLQLIGTTRLLLISPDLATRMLSEYSFLHPRNRQAQSTPNFDTLRWLTDHGANSTHGTCGAEENGGEWTVVELQPGDAVYIPPYWFHEGTAVTSSTLHAASTEQKARFVGKSGGTLSLNYRVAGTDAGGPMDASELLTSRAGKGDLLPEMQFSDPAGRGAGQMQSVKSTILAVLRLIERVRMAINCPKSVLVVALRRRWTALVQKQPAIANTGKALRHLCGQSTNGDSENRLAALGLWHEPQVESLILEAVSAYDRMPGAVRQLALGDFVEAALHGATGDMRLVAGVLWGCFGGP